MRRLLAVLLLLVAPWSGAAEPVRYVSDELVIVVRERADTGAPVLASLNSGARLQLLESVATAGYVQVRLDDGRTGWVQERYLSASPPARIRAEAAEKRLAQAEAELKALREEHARLLKDFTRISAGQPPPPPDALLKELEELQRRVQDLQQRNAALAAQGGEAREQQRTLALGGLLVVVGFVLAWLIRWLWPRRSRWGDL